METVPRLYVKARPGADYQGSLELFRQFHIAKPSIPTKSGLMLGIGETIEEVEAVMRDLLSVGCSMLTLGQYLQPSKSHLAVEEYVTPAQFDRYAEIAKTFGFKQVVSAPLVRSSYHADLQAKAVV
jgi:lipoic acid synthetase